ncbi:MAG: histidine phosphatase family protein [Loktanella sp.]|nr:histidine phosphatase family protein [Loktanella sp.]
MKRLFLVRHGESIWNATRRLQGQADMPLSDRGLAQVKALAPLIGRLAPDVVLTSDLQRAMQTAQGLGYPAAKPEPRLREINVGDWTGQAISTLNPEQYKRWRAGTYAPEGGEQWPTFLARTCAVVAETQNAGQSTTLIVCHGGVIRALLDGLIGLPPHRLLPVGPASLTVLALRDGQARLEAMNVTADGLSLDAPD